MNKNQAVPPSPFTRLLQFVKPHSGGFVKSIVLELIAVICGVLPYFFAAKIIVALISGNTQLRFYAFWCTLAALSFIVKSVASSLSTSTSHEATFQVLSEVRRALCLKIAQLPMGYVLESPSGKLKSVVVERVEQMEVPLAHAIPELSSNLLVPLAILGYIFILDWRMALAVLSVFALSMLCYILMMHSYPKHYGEVMAAGNHLSATTVEYIGGIQVIKVFNQTDGSYGKFSDAVHRNADAILAWMRSTQGYSAVMMSLITAVLISVLPVGLLCHTYGNLPTDTLIICVLLSLGIVEPLAGAVFLTDDVAKVSTVMHELGSILDAEEMHRPKTPVDITQFDIVFDNVCFGYGEKEILHGISLDIRQNGTLALVGESGSGKSTIAKLIASMWDTCSGQIRIGGVNVKDIPLEQMADLVSYVAQDNYLFNDTIRNNIRMGAPGASDEQVEEAAKASGCHEFIMALPDGYETICGASGGQLSGGERQRVTIARAMMKNAPIVVLDEATSYTDPENENVIQTAINILTQGKTLIMIAHRLSTVTNADKIVLLNAGQVEAEGTHEELLHSNAHYRAMWEAHIGVKDGESA